MSGPSIALLMQSSAVICVTDLSLMGEQLRTTLCHRGGVEARARLCVCIFVPRPHDFVCLHLEMWTCEAAMVCACVCVYAGVSVCASVHL